MAIPIYQTKDGQPIDFVIYDTVPTEYASKDKGYTLIQIKAFIGGRYVGNIKLSWIPFKVWQQEYEHNILRYAQRFKGHCFDIDDPKALFVWGWPNLPDSISERIVIATERMLNRYALDREADYHFHVDKPLVAYIEVENCWRRQGIGTNLYLFAARFLQKRDLKLFASGCQTKEAKAAWEYLATRDDCAVKSVKAPRSRAAYQLQSGSRCGGQRRYLVPKKSFKKSSSMV